MRSLVRSTISAFTFAGVASFFIMTTGCSAASDGADGSTASTAQELDQNKFQGWKKIPNSSLFAAPTVITQGRDNSEFSIFGTGLIPGSNVHEVYTTYANTLDNGASWGYSPSLWRYLGGNLLGKAAATAWGTALANIALVGRGTDNQFYVDVQIGQGPWSNWNSSLPPANSVMDAAITYAGTTLYAFVICSIDQQIYITKNDTTSSASYDGSKWTLWAKVPGYIASGTTSEQPVLTEPAAVAVNSPGGNTLMVTAAFANHVVMFNKSTDGGATWGTWVSPNLFNTSSGLAITASPASGTTRVDLFETANAGSIYSTTSYNLGLTWQNTPIQLVNGASYLGPSAVTSFDGTVVHTVVTGTDTAAWFDEYR